MYSRFVWLNYFKYDPMKGLNIPACLCQMEYSSEWVVLYTYCYWADTGLPFWLDPWNFLVIGVFHIAFPHRVINLKLTQKMNNPVSKYLGKSNGLSRCKLKMRMRWWCKPATLCIAFQLRLSPMYHVLNLCSCNVHARIEEEKPSSLQALSTSKALRNDNADGTEDQLNQELSLNQVWLLEMYHPQPKRMRFIWGSLVLS